LEQGLEILKNLSSERRRGDDENKDENDQKNEMEEHEELKYWTSS